MTSLDSGCPSPDIRWHEPQASAAVTLDHDRGRRLVFFGEPVRGLRRSSISFGVYFLVLPGTISALETRAAAARP